MESHRIRNAKPMKESLAKTRYDLMRAEQFVPFSILFASGQRFEIKSREHIGLGPVSRSDVEGLKAVIVWDDVGKWRSVYMPAILKVDDRSLTLGASRGTIGILIDGTTRKLCWQGSTLQ
jgi:hypothetical protein